MRLGHIEARAAWIQFMAVALNARMIQYDDLRMHATIVKSAAEVADHALRELEARCTCESGERDPGFRTPLDEEET